MHDGAAVHANIQRRSPTRTAAASYCLPWRDVRPAAICKRVATDVAAAGTGPLRCGLSSAVSARGYGIPAVGRSTCRARTGLVRDVMQGKSSCRQAGQQRARCCVKEPHAATNTQIQEGRAYDRSPDRLARAWALDVCRRQHAGTTCVDLVAAR